MGNMDRCVHCGFEATSAVQHIQHQRIHEGSFNFHFTCPISLCHSVFLTYASMKNHLFIHTLPRNEMPGGEVEDAGHGVGLMCDLCGRAVKMGNKNWCDHFLNEHLKSGTDSVPCPLYSVCESSRKFQTVLQLRPHLSQYHPGWNRDSSSTSIQHPHNEEGSEFHEERNEQLGVEVPFMDATDEHEGDHCYITDDGSSSSDCDENSFDGECGYSDENFASYFAKFYAFMQGKLFIPASSIQKISEKLAFISEVLQARYREVLVKNLTDVGLTEEQISSTVTNVLSTDPFYNTHHKTAVGVSLTTEHLRRTYFEKNFQYVEPVEHTLKINPRDRTHTIQYVPVVKTLEVMLADVSVQREIDLSFQEKPESDIIQNYTDGLACKHRNPPAKRIDVLIFQDGFSCPNPLGSAKNKHKCVGIYMTLGNLRPHLRSRMKSKRLVMMVNQKTFDMEKGVEKSFRPLVSDLKKLESSGILYKNEVVPVRLQFLLGDNLGQHTIGGFLESFSTEYFCRFCTYTKTKFKEDQNQEEPVFRSGKWRTPASYERALAKKGDQFSCKGIKSRSVFNELDYFKVSDPGQPGCIAHDLFIGGVVDCDLSSMLVYYVGKDWFSYNLLNKRVMALTCEGSDGRNKPATVNTGGHKLGGHSAQNWTLLRILPIIIGDKIEDQSDPVWELYLLLKSICEHACAPALTLSQIEYMRTLIHDYMRLRKCLSNKYKPKHHYFSHLPDLYLYFGPLIHVWTLGFEQFHGYFKKVAKSCNNFINLTFTLANRHQLMQAYQSTGVLFPDGAVECVEESPLFVEDYSNDIQERLTLLNVSSNAMTMKKINFNDIEYKVMSWILLGPVPGESSIYIGKIKLIVFDQTYHLVVNKCKAVLWEEYGLFRIVKRNRELTSVTLDKYSENPFPHGVYKFKNKKCVSLKHVFPK